MTARQHRSPPSTRTTRTVPAARKLTHPRPSQPPHRTPRPRTPARTLATLLAALPFPLAAQQPTPPTAPRAITLPAHSGYAHPAPEAIHRHDDGSVSRCSGSLVFYLRIAQAGDLHVELTRTANAPATELLVALAPHHAEELPQAPTSAPTSTPAAAPSSSPAPAPAPTSRERDAKPTTDTHNPTGTTTNTQTESRATLTANTTTHTFPLRTTHTGWHTLTLRTTDTTPLRAIHHLTLSGPATADLHTNTEERRNAASVHLGYPVPKAHRDDIEWLYVEVTPRTDPLWTYYMATGWHRGYFGMQVNSPTERRLIFSVWDAGNEAIDRKKVAANDRVTLIAKGDGVVAEDFGNEGTGGHSHLVHDWRLGATYRFLLHARPDGDGTVYSGWFWFDERAQWGLIASFRAPKDGKRLHGLYSFSENFSGANGDRVRDCEFGNVHVRTAGGAWLPILDARFTHDPTGERVRSDRWGGARGERFYLHQGGFAEPPADSAARGGATITVPRTVGTPPAELPTPPR